MKKRAVGPQWPALDSNRTLKGRKTMTLLIVLAFPEIVVFIALMGIYSKQLICGTEEWN